MTAAARLDVVGPVRELARSAEHQAADGFDVTVAVCFANSELTLADTLASLAAQVDAPRMEVLLVSNATTDGSCEVARRSAAGLAYRLVECPSAGYDANARNVSMVEAAAPLLLMLDSDDVADRRYVVCMTAALQSSALVTAQWELARLNPHLVASGAGPVLQQPPLPFRQGGWSFAPAGTLGMRRSVVEQVGGFDPTLVYAANNEWCWRAFASGIEVVPAQDAVVHYRLRGSVRTALRQHYRWAVWEVGAAAVATRYGLPRRGWRSLGVGTAVGLLASLPGLRTPFGRLHAGGLLGRAAGRVVGSLRFRRLDL